MLDSVHCMCPLKVVVGVSVI
uniref:Uncharacterized protein n=1 Tax=Arundo donax TaxID=35708 RepID=A0A0A9HVR3_ARUDO